MTSTPAPAAARPEWHITGADPNGDHIGGTIWHNQRRAGEFFIDTDQLPSFEFTSPSDEEQFNIAANAHNPHPAQCGECSDCTGDTGEMCPEAGRPPVAFLWHLLTQAGVPRR